jgi:hypothetical protein
MGRRINRSDPAKEQRLSGSQDAPPNKETICRNMGDLLDDLGAMSRNVELQGMSAG